jgi:hypothetical protein
VTDTYWTVTAGWVGVDGDDGDEDEPPQVLAPETTAPRTASLATQAASEVRLAVTAASLLVTLWEYDADYPAGSPSGSPPVFLQRPFKQGFGSRRLRPRERLVGAYLIP